MSERVCLGDVITLEYGRSLPAARRRAGNVPVYGSNGITGWHDEALIPGPVIVIGRKGSIGEVQYEPGPAFPIDTTYYARPRPGISVEPRYLYYTLRVARLTELNSATGVPGLNREHAYRVPIKLPSFDEQRRIVGLLDRAAEIRRRADAARAKARSTIPALFFDMFGDPATNPKGWPIRTLSDLLAISLSYGSMVSPKAGPDAWRDIRVANIRDGSIDHTDTKYVELEGSLVAKHTLQDGDIVMARAIGSEKHLGKCAVAWPGRERWAYDSHIMRIRANHEAVSPIWLHAFMCSDGGKARLLSRARASAIQHNVNTKEIAATLVPLPPLRIQTIFAEQAQRLETIVLALDTAAAKAETMAAALSAEVFG